jgi:hypothetical protein
MFHGWRLQGVKHIRQWSKQGMDAELEVLPLDDFFTNIKRPILEQMQDFWMRRGN